MNNQQMLRHNRTITRIKRLSLACLGSVAALVLIPAAQADSDRIKWNNNGHYYQRFDTIKTWHSSEAACENMGAHLVTISSVGENDFIKAQLLVNTPPSSSSYYFIGATDEDTQNSWKWVTGEAWNYTNWYSSEPDNSDFDNYLAIGDDHYSSYYGYWFDLTTNYYAVAGYLCEWESNTYVGIASVPDLTGNGWAEDATLYVDYKTQTHTVAIKDPKTHAPVSTLTFIKNFKPPQGLAVLEDMDGNGRAEIAVLYYDATYRLARVKIKDAKDNTQYIDNGKLTFLDPNYAPVAISAVPDTNGNGASEITVLGKHKKTGKAKSETRDSKTGALLGSNTF